MKAIVYTIELKHERGLFEWVRQIDMFPPQSETYEWIFWTASGGLEIELCIFDEYPKIMF